jgi:hypothetical protein
LAGLGACLAQWGPRRCAVHSAVGTKDYSLKSSQGKFEVRVQTAAFFFQSEADSKAPFDLFGPVHRASLIDSGRLVSLTLRCSVKKGARQCPLQRPISAGCQWPLPRSSAGLRAIADKGARLHRPAARAVACQCQRAQEAPHNPLRHVLMRQCDKHANLGLRLATRVACQCRSARGRPTRAERGCAARPHGPKPVLIVSRTTRSIPISKLEGLTPPPK